MPSKKSHFHGSDIEKIASMYDIQISDVVNYSANVNPIGLSPTLVKALAQNVSVIESYPDRDYTNLRQHLSDYTGTHMEHVIVGNGSTELIALFIQSVKPKKALIIGPTYSEYEREITLNDGTVDYFALNEAHGFRLDIDGLKEALSEHVDILIICNPNNPTSTTIPTSLMEKIVAMCHEKAIDVMIDETYIEFTEDMSLYSSSSLIDTYDNLFIIRGVSKFFAAPGLRLGYGLCGNTRLLSHMNHVKFPWTINSLASYAGEVMFTDKAYMKQTKELIIEERKRLYDIMSKWKSVHAYEPTANFMLVKLLRDDIDARDVFEYLIARHMMIRNASSFKFLDERYFRFCFMKPADNDRLIEALKAVLSEDM
ncbi:aminotransferase class I/II-fold pyridoxal phosphate-dependent enzyme [Vallitalea pronyensis]|uniref:Aminotransferase n=1 Tax=Vallitalea pronyensis TaxID=1348613 RepID=A0A8J8MHK1_9FIRM|nr:histidinol-phosphate transaminase [Vallitalea pronyensis]QUI21947.1 aminotransferase class I/II-fold pyridoxal phosphate-dependent enzyme [Vallitalea pronyensis]